MAKSRTYSRTLSYGTWEVRLDVDGDYPQNKASVTLVDYNGHWVIDATPVQGQGNAWEGDWWYRSDDASSLSWEGGRKPDRFKIVWGQDSIGEYVNLYLYEDAVLFGGFYLDPASGHFRTVDVEFDYEAGVNEITSINPHDVDGHRPGSLPNEDITVESTFAKAGIEINKNVNVNEVATAGAGVNSQWSNAELHDAMQVQWSKSEAMQWAMWVFQADRHEDDVAGTMFDSIGPFQRCGTAIFHGQSSYASLPPGTVDRHKFMTLIHEMGHALNLNHSWLKTAGIPWSNTVINEPEARSYMNYASRVNAGYYGFFDTFEYRFSDQELTFLRHGLASMVQPGGSRQGVDNAGSVIDVSFSERSAEGLERQSLQLIVRSNKAKPVYEYLELVNLELKLKNTGTTDKKVPQGILEDIAHMHIRISRNGEPAKVFRPYATPCNKEDPLVVLKPGESLYGSLFLSAGKFGWAVSDPGVYEVRVSVHSHNEEVDAHFAGRPYRFAVAEPGQASRRERKEREVLAQDVFSDEVGRTLAMGGTKYLTGANEVLQELSERFPASKAAQHARIALALPNTREGYKLLTLDQDGGKRIVGQKSDEKLGNQAIKRVLVDGGQETIETLGHVAFQRVSDKVARELKTAGDDAGAKQVQRNVLAALGQRGVKLPEKVRRKLEEKAD